MIPGLASGLGSALGSGIPYLISALFGGGQRKAEKERNQAETALLKLRAQLAQQNIQRQAQLAPLFSQLSGPQGVSQLLPRYMQNQLMPTQPRQAQPRYLPPGER